MKRIAGKLSSLTGLLLNLLEKHVFSVRSYFLAGRNLEGFIGTPLPSVPLKIRRITPADLSGLDGRLPGRKIASCRKRLQKGQICFLALAEGRDPAGLAVVSKGHDSNKRMTINLGKDEGVVIEIYTLPAFRGRRIQSYMVSEAIKYLRTLGCRKVWAAYETGSSCAQKVFMNNNFIETSRVRVYYILGIQFKRTKSIFYTDTDAAKKPAWRYL